MISILIPNKDYAEWVGQAIESALNQTYKDFEVIVCDDNSEDNSIEIIKKYPVKLILKRDGKPSEPSCRNWLIREAKGDFILFCDSDNFLDPDYLEEMVRALDNNTDGVYCNYKYVDVNGNFVKDNSLPRTSSREELHYMLLRPTAVICMNAVLIPKKVFDKIGLLNEEMLCGDEIEFFIRATRYFYFKYFPKFLVNCRLHNKQQSSKYIGLCSWQIKGKELAIKWLKEKGELIE